MKLHRTAVVACIVSAFAVCESFGGADMWITAYYPWWFYNIMKPSVIDYSKMTDLVIFSANPVQQSPFLDVLVNQHDSSNVVNGLDTGMPSNFLEETVRRAHSQSVRVLLSVGGIYGVGAQNMHYIALDNSRINTFVTAACAFAKRWGLDGIELDWEHPTAADRVGYARLIMRFREELDRWSPRGKFICAVNHTPFANLGYNRDSMIAAFDQINPMTYEMYAGDFRDLRTGYNTPINVPTQYSKYTGYALNSPGIGIKAWMAYGIPASKLGLSISFTTVVFSDVVSPVEPGQKYARSAWGYFKDVPSGGRKWDDIAGVPWQSAGSMMITYDDTSSCRLKVEYAKSLGLGGIMLYDLGSGYVPSESIGKRDQLLQSVTRAVGFGALARGGLQDTTKPKVVLTSVKQGATLSGRVTLSAVATDNVSIVGVQFKIDGHDFGLPLMRSPFVSRPLNSWLLSNGRHTFSVEALDGSNNSSTANVTVEIRNTGTAPRFQDLLIFDDSLAPPFIDASWGVRTDYKSTKVVRTGKTSVLVDYTDFGALRLQQGTYGAEVEIDPVTFDALVFDVFPLSSIDLEVVFSNGQTFSVSVPANQWSRIEVPLKFSSPFTSVYFRKGPTGSSVVHFDKICFKARHAGELFLSR